MKIGMIVAMEKEVAALFEKIGRSVRTEEVTGLKVSVYDINGHELYVTVSGVGEIYAAAAAQMLLTKYGVEMLMNFGVCGGLTSDMGVHSAVVVDRVVHYDFDGSQGDEKLIPCQYPDHESIYLCTTPELVKLAIAADPALEAVTCASADKFVGMTADKVALNERYGAKICEMESAGIVLTAERAGVPVLLIKAVSDSVGSGMEEYQKLCASAAECCARVVLKVLENV